MITLTSLLKPYSRLFVAVKLQDGNNIEIISALRDKHLNVFHLPQYQNASRLQSLRQTTFDQPMTELSSFKSTMRLNFTLELS